MGAGVGGVDGGEAGGGPDVGDDEADVFLGDNLADEVFDLGDFVFRDAETRAGGGFESDDELAGVRAGEEGKPKMRIESETCDKDNSDSGEEPGGPLQHAGHRAGISIKQAPERRIELRSC